MACGLLWRFFGLFWIIHSRLLAIALLLRETIVPRQHLLDGFPVGNRLASRHWRTLPIHLRRFAVNVGQLNAALVDPL